MSQNALHRGESIDRFPDRIVADREKEEIEFRIGLIRSGDPFHPVLVPQGPPFFRIPADQFGHFDTGLPEAFEESSGHPAGPEDPEPGRGGVLF